MDREIRISLWWRKHNRSIQPAHTRWPPSVSGHHGFLVFMAILFWSVWCLFWWVSIYAVSVDTYFKYDPCIHNGLKLTKKLKFSKPGWISGFQKKMCCSFELYTEASKCWKITSGLSYWLANPELLAPLVIIKPQIVLAQCFSFLLHLRIIWEFLKLMDTQVLLQASWTTVSQSGT